MSAEGIAGYVAKAWRHYRDAAGLPERAAPDIQELCATPMTALPKEVRALLLEYMARRLAARTADGRPWPFDAELGEALLAYMARRRQATEEGRQWPFDGEGELLEIVARGYFGFAIDGPLNAAEAFGIEALAAEYAEWDRRPSDTRKAFCLQALIRWRSQWPEDAEPWKPGQKASLPALHRASAEDKRTMALMPAMDHAPDDGQLTLASPDFEAPEDGFPSWLLNRFRLIGAEFARPGKGAPYELRLGIAFMLHLGIDERDGHWHRITLPASEVVGWLHPDGWDNERRDWALLPKALGKLHRSMFGWRVKADGHGEQWLRLAEVPLTRESMRNGRVAFDIRIPSGAARGDRIDWDVLRAYGQRNSPLYCGYLSAVAILGRTARGGKPLTRTLPAPVLGADGKRLRGRDGRVMRHASERVDNPVAARVVRTYSAADLARFTARDPKVRVNRQRAVDTFEELAADGHIELVRDGKGYRIFAPERRRR